MKLLKHLVLAGLLALPSWGAWADPGVSDTSIALGMSAPFSGPNGAYGNRFDDRIVHADKDRQPVAG